eukprot:190344-Chlamydomonas_euryale.AAC.2
MSAIRHTRYPEDHEGYARGVVNACTAAATHSGHSSGSAGLRSRRRSRCWAALHAPSPPRPRCHTAHLPRNPTRNPTLALAQEYQGALAAFKKLHAMLPDNTEVIHQIATVYDILGDFKNSVKWFEMLSSLVPNDPGVLARLGAIHARFDDEIR